jgi:sugar lactone lactonase YvrE
MRLRQIASVLASICTLGACTSAQQPAPEARTSCAAIETLAAYPNGNFLENLIVESAGRVLFTSYFAKTIEAYDSGHPVHFAALDVHPVSIAPLQNGYLVAAHGAAFNSGPAFTSTNQLLMLGRDGTVQRRIPVPDARFLNGMATAPDGAILIADAGLGAVWRFDPASGAVALWFSAPEMAPDPSGTDPRPGVNGIEILGATFLFSNSYRGALYRVALGSDGKPTGAIEIVAKTGAIDDFAVAPGGVFYFATHEARILRVGADGALSTVLPEGADGSTAVALAGVNALYVLTTGGLLEGGRAEAKLLRIALPGGPKMCTTR